MIGQQRDLEVELCAYLVEHGYPSAARRVPLARVDRGPISGTPVEISASAAESDRIGVLDLANEHARRANKVFGAVIRRRGGAGIAQAVVTLNLSDFTTLLSAAYPADSAEPFDAGPNVITVCSQCGGRAEIRQRRAGSPPPTCSPRCRTARDTAR